MKKVNNSSKYCLIILSTITICLAIISLSLVATTISKYVSSKIDDNKSTIAKFDVSELLENGGIEQVLNVNLKPGESITENVIVTNSGDVQIRYSISIINETSNLPLTFTSYDGVINPHTSNQSCPITISWPEDKNSPSYSGKVDVIKISISVEQVVEVSWYDEEV